MLEVLPFPNWRRVRRGKVSLSMLVAALSLLSIEFAAAVDRPNIVLVMADDQGWGDMAYNGHPHLETPNFDALAREGVRFDRFYAAAPVCSPTRASVLTGRTPNRTGCLNWGHPLRPQEITVADALKAAGYRTGHFGKWHLGSVLKGSPVNPGEFGFDEWISSPNFFDLDPILSDQGKAIPFEGESAEITVDLALRFIQECARQDEAFFAVVWFGSPHVPHEALEADRELYRDRPAAEQKFLAEITAMDRAFGRLRSDLRELGLHEDTLVWYCSDNGAIPQGGSTGGAREKKGSIYDGGLLVPALLEWPARFPAPSIVAAPCVTSDIYPTLLELAGVEVGGARPLDGVSLAPLLDGKTEERPGGIGFWSYPAAGFRTPAKLWMEAVYEVQQQGGEPDDPAMLYLDAGEIGDPVPVDRFPGHAAWIEEGWKLHRIEAKGTSQVRWELYDLGSDPGESRDLLAEEGERFAALRAHFEPWLESVARSLNGEDYELK